MIFSTIKPSMVNESTTNNDKGMNLAIIDKAFKDICKSIKWCRMDSFAFVCVNLYSKYELIGRYQFTFGYISKEDGYAFKEVMDFLKRNNDTSVGSFEPDYAETEYSYILGCTLNVEEEENNNSDLSKYLNESARSELPNSSFGIPEDRKFPLDSKEHVKSAIKLFGHAEESKKKSLAKRIYSAAKKYDVLIPKDTQVYKYYHESYGLISNETFIDEFPINESNEFFPEDDSASVVELETPSVSEYSANGPIDTVYEILENTDPKRIFISSDWHFFSLKYKKEKNPVNTAKIVKWCKDNIKENDVFMYLGDMCYRWATKADNDYVAEVFRSLPGIKVLIIGNHDQMASESLYLNCGFDYVFDELRWRDILFTHKPVNIEHNPNYKIQIHGHIHNYREYNTTDGKRNINVYPYYYNNKPVTLDYILNHVEELTKENKRSNWIGMGESTMDENYIKALDCLFRCISNLPEEFMCKRRDVECDDGGYTFAEYHGIKDIEDLIEILNYELSKNKFSNLYVCHSSHILYIKPKDKVNELNINDTKQNHSGISWWYVCDSDSPSCIDEEQYYKTLNDAVKYYTDPKEFENTDKVEKYVYTCNGDIDCENALGMICLGMISINKDLSYEWLYTNPIEVDNDGILRKYNESTMIIDESKLSDVYNDIKNNIANINELKKQWRAIAGKFVKHKWIYRYINKEQKEMLDKYYKMLTDEDTSYGEYTRAFKFICRFMGLDSKQVIIENLVFENDKKDKDQMTVAVKYSKGFAKVIIPNGVKLTHVSPADNITELIPSFRSKVKGKYMYPSKRVFFTVKGDIKPTKAGLEKTKTTRYTPVKPFTVAYIDPTYPDYADGSVYIETKSPIPVEKWEKAMDKLFNKFKIDKSSNAVKESYQCSDEDLSLLESGVYDDLDLIEESKLSDYLDQLRKWKTANQDHSKKVFKSNTLTNEEYEMVKDLIDKMKTEEDYKEYKKAFDKFCSFCHIVPRGTIICKYEVKKGSKDDNNSLYAEFSYNTKKIQLPKELALFHMSQVPGIKELKPFFRGKSQKGYLYDKPRIYLTIREKMPKFLADYKLKDKLHKYRVKGDIKDAYVDPLVWANIQGAIYVETNKPIPVEDITNGKPEEQSKSKVNEWSMAACNPIVGIVKPFILKVGCNDGQLIDTKQYALAPDIISDKYVVVDENSTLKVVDSSEFNNCFIEEYEYIGDRYNLSKIDEAYRNGAIVDSSFLYTALSGKPLLSDDQIDFDESFVKVNFDLMKEKRETAIATIKEQWSVANDGQLFSLPLLESVFGDKINSIDENITIMESVDGYYIKNNLTGKRSRTVNNTNDITEDIINSTY